MKRIISLVMALALVLTAMVVPAVAENQDVRTVEFWHTLTGVNGAAVEAIADHFNATVGAEKGIVVRATTTPRSSRPSRRRLTSRTSRTSP